MKKSALIALAVLIAGTAPSSLLFAQQAPATQPAPVGRSDWRPTAADRAAFLDARIAGLKAGLKLNPEQEKLWPPVETALRETAAKREARMDAFRQKHEQRQGSVDAIERMRQRAELLTETGVDLKKMADAAAPLYAALDDAQKHRMDVLLRMRGPHHFRMAARENGLRRSRGD
jgi:zinc resistance-associated protein